MWEMTLSLTAVKYQYSSAEKATLVQRNIKIPLDEIFNDSSLCLTIEKSQLDWDTVKADILTEFSWALEISGYSAKFRWQNPGGQFDKVDSKIKDMG